MSRKAMSKQKDPGTRNVDTIPARFSNSVLVRFSARMIEGWSASAPKVLLLVLVILSTSVANESAAQDKKRIGIGVEVGTETGVTLKLKPDEKISYELLAAWNIGDFLFLNGHAVYTKALEENPRVRALYGLGAYVGVYESNRSDNAFLGISARGAVVYAVDQYEVYFHLTPRFNLLPGTDLHLGGGLGFRVYI
jgi:hypothetical protein